MSWQEGDNVKLQAGQFIGFHVAIWEPTLGRDVYHAFQQFRTALGGDAWLEAQGHRLELRGSWHVWWKQQHRRWGQMVLPGNSLTLWPRGASPRDVLSQRQAGA